MRVLGSVAIASFGILALAGWPACQPSSPTATRPNGARGITVLYQNNANGEIEPCG
jgi:hypothetical protein